MSNWNYAKWAYETGLENLAEHREAGDYLATQSSTLLTVLLAGIGGGIALGAPIFDSAGPAEWGAAISAVWLAIVAMGLSHHCIITKETQLRHNEPANIYLPALNPSETQVYEWEAENVQVRINKTKVRNACVALWLDRCRYAAILTPGVFAVVALVAAAC